MTPDFHLVPFEALGRPHSASRDCFCGPVAVGREAALGAVIYRHRLPGAAMTAQPVQQRRARTISTGRRGRPPLAPITRAALVEAATTRAGWGPGPPTQESLAADLGESRTRVREAVVREFGDWSAFVANYRGTSSKP